MGKKPKLAKRATKSGTPKPVRRAIARAKIRAQKYLGVPVRAKVKKGKLREGASGTTRTFLKSGKARSEITLSSRLFRRDGKRKINAEKIGEVARHEFFHAGIDGHLLTEGRKGHQILSEALATLSTMELEIERREKRKNRTYSPQETSNFAENIREGLLAGEIVRGEENPIYYWGLLLATNILREYPRRKDRKKYIRKLVERNAKIARDFKNDKKTKVSLTELGEFVPVEEEK